MAKSKYSGRFGLEVMHDIIRCNIGYGRVFSKQDLLRPMACTPGVLLPAGTSTNDQLEDLVKYGYLHSFGNREDPQYLLIRNDRRKEPVMGFNSRRK